VLQSDDKLAAKNLSKHRDDRATIRHIRQYQAYLFGQRMLAPSTVYGSLSVITTLEFLEHHFAKVGHG